MRRKTENRGLPTIWTRHLVDPSQKESFEKVIRNSTLLMSRIQDMLNELDQEIERSEISTKAFEDPNWQYRQAHINGQKNMLYKLKDIFNV